MKLLEKEIIITNNIFCIKHPTNCLINGRSNSGKTNVLMNLIAQNCIGI